MVNGALYFLPTSRDLRLQRSDAGLKLGDRQRIEILAREQRHRIVLSRRKVVVGGHGQRFGCMGARVNGWPPQIHLRNLLMALYRTIGPNRNDEDASR